MKAQLQLKSQLNPEIWEKYLVDIGITNLLDLSVMASPLTMIMIDLPTKISLSRPNAEAQHRRVIVDLSFPDGQSVNSGVKANRYLDSDFLLSLPNIDNITNKIKTLGRGSLTYKIDISRAFQHVKVDPHDSNLLGLKLDQYYFDTYIQCAKFAVAPWPPLFKLGPPQLDFHGPQWATTLTTTCLVW